MRLRIGAGAIGLGLGLVAGVVVLRHRRLSHRGDAAPREVLIGDVRVYDFLTRLVLGSLYRSIAADVASVAADGARVLEVGCGPGNLAIRLAREPGLKVTGLDLDPRMIDLARGNARRVMAGSDEQPSFVVGDVASLPFPDASFDLVVSTLSMHHWAEPDQGLAEIRRVLRPGGRALMWDIRRGRVPFHGHPPESLASTAGLRLVGSAPWRWPWRMSLLTRFELVSVAETTG